MIKYSKIDRIDKSTLIFLSQFETQFVEDTRSVLNSKDFESLKVSYSMSVKESDNSGHPYKVDSNANLSLENSNQLVCRIIDYLNSREKELSVFLTPKFQLSIKIVFDKKENVKSASSEDSNEVTLYLPKEPRYSFAQVILPQETLDDIFDALNIVKYQNLIYKEWGFEDIDPIPKSVINFYGPPGTGKTMCAHAVAKELGFKLLALNYAEIESKYVGDAAKNLSNAFETAKQNNCVVFFDEADSFLGKRIKNVSQGADQALNSLRSQMLILLEEFSGVVIFATNLVSNFDQAFESRILKHIHFSLPNEDARIAIIKGAIPSKLPLLSPLSESDYKNLSVLMEGLSGREIKGAILECMLNKVSLDGNNSIFSYEDFRIAFEKKQESIKKLQEEKNKDKRGKILEAFENGRVNKENNEEANDYNTIDIKTENGFANPLNNSDANRIILDKKETKLICLVSEMGSFFGKCDGAYDDSEKVFVDNYLNTLAKKHAVPQNDLIIIKQLVNENETIDDLIYKTNSFADSLNAEEQLPLKRTLSYFIYHLIRADGVLHPNEIKYYKEWKNGVNIDDNIDISSYI
ncbi:MAG: AAA family ATPase [Prevotella sp.]|nr:AAA family ATPase [Prevotella sp.]